MPTDNEKPGGKISWSGIVTTILSGLLLAGFTYVISTIAVFSFAEKAEIYFIDRPASQAAKFHKLIIIENFSTGTLGDVQFTVPASNITLSLPVNLDSVEQHSIAPRTIIIRLSGVLPNRQASVLLESDAFISEEGFRLVKGPLGVRFKSKDRLVDSWFDWSLFYNFVIQFVIYVVGMLLFEKRMARTFVELDDLKSEIKDRKERIERLEQGRIKSQLTQVRRLMSLSSEVRLWRGVVTDALRQATKDQDSAKKLLNIILVKAGIRPTKTIDALDEEELVDAIEEAKARIAELPRL